MLLGLWLDMKWKETKLKTKWRQGGVIREDKAGWKVRTEEEENKDHRKENNFAGRKFASLNLYFISSINTSTICVGVAQHCLLCAFTEHNSSVFSSVSDS